MFRRARIASAKTLKMESVDFMIKRNTKHHHTDEYDITSTPEEDEKKYWTEPRLVVRRGQNFLITIKTTDKYDKTTDILTVIFTGLSDSRRSWEDNRVRVQAGTAELKPREWGAKIVNTDENSVSLSIMPAVDCPVGKWRMDIESSVKDHSGVPKSKIRAGDIYILFNAWCPDDQVYVGDEVLVDEYVMNDSGIIYRGSSYRQTKKHWNFAQFEDIVLDCALMLLDRGQLEHEKRGDAIWVSRVISAVVNSSDADRGLLTGNWSGDYSGGVSPLEWAGSHEIIKQFWETKKSVRFGQCWVFSGLCTTVGRALGLPTRSVTNFDSAHDTDGTISIDFVFHDGEKYDHPYQHGDSIWNYHVWNEAWMTRPDLPPGYGGWQAFDATPQEPSPYNSIMCAGPCPLKSIKEGEVNVPYDGKFIFAEVNGDVMNWNREEDGSLTKMSIKKAVVGQKISTKMPRHRLDEEASRYDKYIKREDVTRLYKYEEGSVEERRAVRKAAIYSSRPDYYEEEDMDVTFDIQLPEEVMTGSDFDVTVNMVNKTENKRTVETIIAVHTTTYTGLAVALVDKRLFTQIVEPNQSASVVLTITAEQYQPKLTPDESFRVMATSTVQETYRKDVDMKKFSLSTPVMEVTGPEEAFAGEPMKVIVKFDNPLATTLTNCKLHIEGGGLRWPLMGRLGDVEANGGFHIYFHVTPRRPGKERVLIVSFSSDQIHDVEGEAIFPVYRSKEDRTFEL